MDWLAKSWRCGVLNEAWIEASRLLGHTKPANYGGVMESGYYLLSGRLAGVAGASGRQKSLANKAILCWNHRR
jgi:hypothetical protein